MVRRFTWLCSFFVIWLPARNGKQGQSNESAIEQVLLSRQFNNHEQVLKDTEKYGICRFSDKDHIILLVSKCQSNPSLANAVSKAKDSDVVIFACDFFGVGRFGRGWVYIDVRAEDQEIIDFLLGK